MVDKKSICTDAEYLPQVIEEYKENPFIEALPPIYSAAKAADLLTVEPEYHEAERELDAFYRFHCIQRLSRYFQPLDTHIDIEQRVSRSIRQSYVNRNPVMTFEKNDYRSVRTTAAGFTVSDEELESFIREQKESVQKTIDEENLFVEKGDVHYKPGSNTALNEVLEFYNKMGCTVDGYYALEAVRDSLRSVLTSNKYFEKLFNDNDFESAGGEWAAFLDKFKEEKYNEAQKDIEIYRDRLKATSENLVSR